MLIFSRLPEFLWAEAVATACFTQNRSIINTRHNKTPYELLRGRKLNVEYFYVFGSLCYPINDRDDLGKMKPKADIRVFIGYSKTSRGFRIYNRRTKRIMETIHVKFNELTAMASEHDCLEPDLQRFNNPNSSDDLMNTPSKVDLDNLFGPMFEDYFERKSSDTTINSTVQPTHDQADLPSTSSIIVDTDEVPPVFVPYDSLNHEEIVSSTTNLEPLNVQDFHQVQPSTHIWTKDHPLDQVIGDSSKPVMTRQRLHTDSEFHDKRKNVIASMALEELSVMQKHIVVRQILSCGFKVHQSPRGIFISLSQYAIELLKKYGLDECVSMSIPMATKRLDADLQGTPTDQMTYRCMIGGLMYLTTSRPDIAFATFVCARYQARPTVKHLKEVKQIFCWDHAVVKMIVESTSGGVQFLGLDSSWLKFQKKTDCTAMSTAEAEYVSSSACCAQVIWMRTQLLDYGFKYNQIPMYYDSKSAIAISCNSVNIQRQCTLTSVIIMAQRQQAVDVHLDELCPPNKRYDLMDANYASISSVTFGFIWQSVMAYIERRQFKASSQRSYWIGKELTLYYGMTSGHLSSSTSK
ncbi:retrovirus-related pol polyprotein from transposon TNT 1-94 [Tanacetum coccineum]